MFVELGRPLVAHLLKVSFFACFELVAPTECFGDVLQLRLGCASRVREEEYVSAGLTLEELSFLLCCKELPLDSILWIVLARRLESMLYHEFSAGTDAPHATVAGSILSDGLTVFLEEQVEVPFLSHRCIPRELHFVTSCKSTPAVFSFHSCRFARHPPPTPAKVPEEEKEENFSKNLT